MYKGAATYGPIGILQLSYLSCFILCITLTVMAERRGRRREPQANKPDVILQRGMIIGRYQATQSISQISREMGISRNAVKRWIRRYEVEGHVNTRPRPGRPRVTTMQEDASLLAAAQHAPFKSSPTLTRYDFDLSNRKTSYDFAYTSLMIMLVPIYNTGCNTSLCNYL